MLLESRYPEYLKARIRTERGHMQNEETARLLTEIYSHNLRHIFLCHLSAENNTPSKAVIAVKGALEGLGLKVGNGDESLDDREADVSLVALPRTEPTRWYVFR